MKYIKLSSICTLPVLALLVAACSPNSESGDAGVAADSAAAATTAFLLKEVPAGATSLNEAMATASPGDAVLVTGRVGGSVEPLTHGFAGFILADESLVFCDEMGDSHCATPWDACCEDPDKLTASRAFVQFVDASGDPVPVDLKAAIGLSENATVIVQGRLSPDSTPANRIILAEGLAIQ